MKQERLVQEADSHGTIYRPDIDGLRAIAILSVMIFHLGVAVLPGGFVGVDIFFVISGFLITRNILAELERGHFSLLEFYRRRVKRIAPAMLVVVVATVAIAQFIMLPEVAQRTAESGAWSVASLANVYFWRYLDTSYFAAGAEESPLLHLWSLGVEEQFYLLWPLALLLLFRWRGLDIAMILIAAASTGLAEYLFPRDPSFTYYMLPTRAGELLIGAMVARWDLHGGRLSLGSARLAGFAGFALVAGSLWFIRETDVFPGLHSLPPTLGAALLIASGRGPVADLLSLKAVRWIGLVSYSAYLWHWPLIAFWKYGHVSISWVAAAGLFALTFVLAWLSYRFVEQPARASRTSWPRVFAAQYVAPAFVIVVACGVSMKLHGYGVRYFTGYREALASIHQARRPAYDFPYVCQRHELTAKDVADPRCVVGQEKAGVPIAVIWGDSTAAHYVGMVGAFAEQAGYRVRNLEHESCPPIDRDPGQFVAARYLESCRASLEVAREAVEPFETVILSAFYPVYTEAYEADLRALLARLTSEGKRVVLIGEIPWIDFDPRCREKALSYPGLDCGNTTVPPNPEVVAINARLRAMTSQMNGVAFFDPTAYLCPHERCSPFNADGSPMYYDGGHLTLGGSWQLGRRIIREVGVPEAFRLNAGAAVAAK